MEGTEGLLTVLFTDVAGSTELAQKRGDAVARQVLSEHRALVRRELGEHRGREIETAGDSFLATFASARRALTCAIAIQRAQDRHNRAHPEHALGVRIGLSVGEVTVHDEGVFGSPTVNAAARVMAKAEAGEVLVADVVRQVAGTTPGLTFRDRGRFRLKGIDERARLYELVWREEEPPPALSDRTPYVGRDAERAELQRLLKEADGGRGTLVLIGGEPGVGKTRLTEEIAALAAAREFEVLVGHCREMETPAPYLPFVEVLEAATKQVEPDTLRRVLGDAAPEVARLVPHLRRVFADIPEPLELPPEQERRYVFNSVREFIARATQARPQFVVLDDIHWADEASLLLLEHVAEAIPSLRTLVIGTYRDVELATARPLARSLENLLRRRLAVDIRLSRLPEAEVAALLRQLARQEAPPKLVTAIYRETEGNPFFVEEVYKHLLEEGRLFDPGGRFVAEATLGEVEVPRGVRLVIGRRLERLSDPSRQVLAAAAGVGRAFSYRLLEALGDFDGDVLLDAVDEAERARLIVATAEKPEVSFAFAHELIRQSLLADQSLPRRQRLHLKIANALEQRYGTDPEHVAEIASHLYEAGEAADGARTASFLKLAGDRALAAAAFEDALRDYERALELQPAQDRLGRAHLLASLGIAYRTVGRWKDAMKPWEEALDTYEELGDTDATGRLAENAAIQLAWAGDWENVLAVAARGVQAFGPEASAARATLTAIMATAFSGAGNAELSMNLTAEAVTEAREVEDGRALGTALTQLSVAGWFSLDLKTAIDAGREAVQLLRADGDLWPLSIASSILFGALVSAGEWAAAEDLRAECLPVIERVGNRGAALFIRRPSLVLDDAWNDLEVLDTIIEEDLRECREAGLPWHRDALLWRGVSVFQRGDWERGLELMRTGTDYDFPYAYATVNRAQQLLALGYLGREAEALELWAQVEPDFAVVGPPQCGGAWAAVWFAVETAWMLGDHDRAARLYDRALAGLQLGMLWRPWDVRPTACVVGLAAAAAGDWSAAEENFRSALSFTERVTSQRPDTLRFHGESLLRRGAPGDRERAREMLTEAKAGYLKLGWPRHAELAQSLLSR